MSIDLSVVAVLSASTSSSALLPPISLDRPAFLRKHLPDSLLGWPCKDYPVGPENAGLHYLFQTSTIANLASISPILLYGERDLGRMDLAITLAVRWSKQFNKKPLYLTTGIEFCRDFAAALEIGDIQSFLSRLNSCKMLIIDDMDPLADRAAAQDVLASSIDTLSALSRPILLTSSSQPAAISGFSSRLTSRIASGFSMGLVNPERQARNAFLGDLASQLDPLLPIPDLILLADEMNSDQSLTPSNLVLLVKLAKQNLTNEGRLDITLLRSLLKQHQADDAPGIHSIAKLVAKKMRVKLVDLRGTSRISSIIRARGLAILLARKCTTLSLQQIGQYFSGRDHSTILHACRKTSRLLANDPELAKLCRDIQYELLH